MQTNKHRSWWPRSVTLATTRLLSLDMSRDVWCGTGVVGGSSGDIGLPKRSDFFAGIDKDLLELTWVRRIESKGMMNIKDMRGKEGSYQLEGVDSASSVDRI